MEIPVPRSLVGPIPEPADLIGREHLLETFWQYIPSANVLLLAPRRFGKSGIMNHVLKRPREGHLPIYFDVEEFATPRQFFERMVEKVAENDHLRSVLHRGKKSAKEFREWLFSTVEELDIEGASVKFRKTDDENWRKRADLLLKELEKSDERIIFILDELPTMLLRFQESEGGTELVREFMRWFRAARLNPDEKLRDLRFVVGGSNGIDVFLGNAKLDAEINDFNRLYVDELEANAATELVDSLATTLKIDLGETSSSEIFEILGSCVPYFIQMLMQQLALARPNGPLTRSRVEEIYRTQLLGPTCKSYFNHYRSRLDRYDKTSKRCALNLLSAAASKGREPVPDTDLYKVFLKAAKTEDGFGPQRYREILADLECDWYLTRCEEQPAYVFKVGVMRDWWNRWYAPVQ